MYVDDRFFLQSYFYLLVLTKDEDNNQHMCIGKRCTKKRKGGVSSSTVSNPPSTNLARMTREIYHIGPRTRGSSKNSDQKDGGSTHPALLEMMQLSPLPNDRSASLRRADGVDMAASSSSLQVESCFI